MNKPTSAYVARAAWRRAWFFAHRATSSVLIWHINVARQKPALMRVSATVPHVPHQIPRVHTCAPAREKSHKHIWHLWHTRCFGKRNNNLTVPYQRATSEYAYVAQHQEVEHGKAHQKTSFSHRPSDRGVASPSQAVRCRLPAHAPTAQRVQPVLWRNSQQIRNLQEYSQ